MTAGGGKGGRRATSSVGELRRLFSREEWGVAFVIRISLCVRGCLYVKTQRWALTAECSRKSAPYTAVSGHFLLGTGKKDFFKNMLLHGGVKFGVKGWHPD